jgi:hypothetical protein
LQRAGDVEEVGGRLTAERRVIWRNEKAGIEERFDVAETKQ